MKRYKYRLKIMIFIAILALGGIVFYAWRYSGLRQQVGAGPAVLSLDIKRLEDQLFACKSREDVGLFLKDNPLVAIQFLDIFTSEREQKAISQLYAMVQDKALQDLYQEVKEKFGDFSTQRRDLAHAFGRLKQYYPDVVVPSIVTMVTGLSTDIYVGPELIVIGLDFFLGEDATVRPHLPAYMLRTYQPIYIVPKLVLALAETYNAVLPTEAPTLLEEMLYEGKTYFFCKALLPTLAEADLLGYTSQEWKDAKDHQRIIWEHFIEKELFYIKDPMIKRKYIGPRPFTSEIGQGCPGNIGGWLGFEIIKRYMKNHPSITLAQLMEDKDLHALFMKAKYKPA
jgi:hypothetical protein